ncbi:hypothetical protein WICPIJ_001525 [Wickerhamomyces pijperi]|uniref:Uncharacterized protein n=1 Tax=Wickerhamomyces pijperi TaxID=599730 RepID=A0A9P8QDG1_WICPI|nr:hypothetical protein WICPIJ_001525 [Wickerhamomyces pijperi]
MDFKLGKLPLGRSGIGGVGLLVVDAGLDLRKDGLIGLGGAFDLRWVGLVGLLGGGGLTLAVVELVLLLDLLDLTEEPDSDREEVAGNGGFLNPS